MKNKYLILDFDKVSIPLPTESRNTSDDTYTRWGDDNLYPIHLLKLYADSETHGNIINKKTTFICGAGLKNEDGSDIDIEINPSDNIKEFTSKIVKDFVMFDAFAVEVTFNRGGSTSGISPCTNT